MSERRDDPGSGDLESIDGIGPAYRQRLEAAGVATVDDLAAADAASLADATDVAPGRLRKWIDVAAERTGGRERGGGTERSGGGTDRAPASDLADRVDGPAQSAGDDPARPAGGDPAPTDAVDPDDIDADDVWSDVLPEGDDVVDVDATGGVVESEGEGSDPTHPDGTPADGTSTADGTSAGDAAAPLSDLAREVTERRRRREESTDDPFEEMGADAVDADDVWSDVLFGEDGDGSVDADRVGVGAAAERAADAPEDRADHVVPKEEYCQRCPHLDDPPDLRCTHEGTEIVEVVDSERFRVRGCPVVEGAGGAIGPVDPTTDG